MLLPGSLHAFGLHLSGQHLFGLQISGQHISSCMFFGQRIFMQIPQAFSPKIDPDVKQQIIW